MPRDPETLVCLHGLGRSSSDWDRVAPALERLGRVVAPELPRDPREALRRASAATPPGAIVIGHSYGAVLAMRMASRPDAAVRALVLTDSFFPPARNGRSVPASLADYLQHRVMYIREARPRAASPSASRGLSGLGSLARLALRRAEFDAMTSAIHVPVLVVHCRDDHYVPVNFAEAAVARNPMWQLGLLERGGHHPHVDNADGWLDTAAPWIEGLISRER